ncbi:hypothetical protein TWF132_004705 [Orbilia oligospora]|nr:hypothetical protein TWF132_004705 [Orbilia oligospora]
MQAFVCLSWTFLFWPFALGQFEDGQIPQCASTCTYGAFYSPDCQDKDYLCLCKDPTMLTFLIPCTGAMCEPFEIDQTVDAVRELCAGVGVSLTITTTWSTTQSSTTAPPSHRPPETASSSESLITPATTNSNSEAMPSDTSTPETRGEAAGGSKLSAGAIAGVTIGVTVPVVALVGFLFILFRRKGRRLHVPVLSTSQSHETNNWGGIGPDNDIPGQLNEVK